MGSLPCGARGPSGRVEPASLDVLRKLAGQPETGVRLVSGIEASRTPTAPPEWGDQLDGFRMCDTRELPDGFAAGWRFVAPLIDMPVYLSYLQQRFAESGGVLDAKRLNTLAEAAAPLVVNCAGMGARDLVPDPQLIPVRGQLVVVENPDITEFFSEDTGLSPDLLHLYRQAKRWCSAGRPRPASGAACPT